MVRSRQSQSPAKAHVSDQIHEPAPTATPPQVHDQPGAGDSRRGFRALFFQLSLVGLVASVAISLFASGPWSWAPGILYIAYDTVLLGFVLFRILKVLRSKGNEEKKPRLVGSRPSVAILIAARNEAEQLPICLNAVLAQDDAADEIHIIDDGSTDASVENLIKQYKFIKEEKAAEKIDEERGRRSPEMVWRSKTYPALILWAKQHTGKADSLNHVWPKTACQVVVTIDADTFLEVGAIASIRRAFAQDAKLVATGGTLSPRGPNTWLGKTFESYQKFEYIRAFLSRRAWMDLNSLLLVSGAFAAYRKSALTDVGGYSTTSLVEDYELIHNIYRHYGDRKQEVHVSVLFDARASTDVPGNIFAFLRQRRRWFCGFLQTHFAYSAMIGNFRYGSMGRLMLPIKSLDTLQPVYGWVAFVNLVWLIATQGTLHPVILGIIFVKLVVDLVFHFLSIQLYHRWQGTTATKSTWIFASLATLTEPFTFQLLRHTGAVLGWLNLFKRSNDWIPVRHK